LIYAIQKLRRWLLIQEKNAWMKCMGKGWLKKFLFIEPVNQAVDT
jgi:hypothetical protein